jgi:ADP-dependent NAD(P)H-hydrate dehydratase
MPKSPRSRKVTRALLNRFPLPQPPGDGDKEIRGRVLVIGGEASLPGAVILAGTAALRAGAGKLQLASCATIAPHIGVAVPESMSIALRETSEGMIHPAAAKALREHVEATDAVLIGPGLKRDESNDELVTALLQMQTTAGIVLDAGALYVLMEKPDILRKHRGNVIITPHFSEMAALLGLDPKAIEADAPGVAARAGMTYGCVIALKGPTTFIAAPDGDLFHYDSGDVGLATSGSGDTLGGIAAGLLARGAPPLHAALWSVYLHGAAGNALARRVGRVGFLAREIPDEIPRLLRS